MKLAAKVSGAVVLLVALQARPAFAQQTPFSSGSLIIPMDIDYQDSGMLRAFGLVYNLLLHNVPVAWCILPGKTVYTGSTKSPASPGNSVDFTATVKDAVSGTALGTHGYRGGPFVIDAAYNAQALALASAWNAGQKNVVSVHQATAAFTAPVDRVLVNAPNIGVNADGNEAIAFGYMNAAGIPDSAGKAWSGTSPDVMTPAQVAGATTTSHRDGKLWGPTGQPHYCQLMSMHWNVSRDATSNEAIAEMGEFLLNYPVHLFAECQAVNQIEDAATAHFVSTNNGTGTPTTSVACGSTTTPNDGLCARKTTPTPPLEFLGSDLAFAQMDGPFTPVGGSEPAYGLAPGSTYYDQGIVMIREKNVANGANGKSDLWMTGYANFPGGICNLSEDSTMCAGRGKVSYLGGHQYTTNVPISMNGTTQGTRLFLNSLLQADCATADGAANVTLVASGLMATSSPLLTINFAWSNDGSGVAIGAVVTYTLPAGASFVSASNGGVFSAGKVTWTLGDLGPSDNGPVSVTVALGSYGTYQDSAAVSYKVGNNAKTGASNTLTTTYGPATSTGGTSGGTGAGGAGGSSGGGTGPCAGLSDGTPCDDGDDCTVATTCVAGHCGAGVAVRCGIPANPCQVGICVTGMGCTVAPVADGMACSTGDMCVTGQTCSGGACGGGASRSCPTPASPCEVATCDSATGCGSAPGNDGAACDDGDMCTSATSCLAGLCQGGAGCAAAAATCMVGMCGANGCQAMPAAAGTDPRGDCPAIGGCARSCDGAGSCTKCPGASGAAGSGGGAGGDGTAGNGAAGGASGDAGASGAAMTGVAGGSAGGADGASAGASGSAAGSNGNGAGGVTASAGVAGSSAAGGHGASGAKASGSDAAQGGCGCSFDAAPGDLSLSVLLPALGLMLGALKRRPRRSR